MNYSKFYAILKQLNANGLALTKEQSVSDFTESRTTSLRSLSIGELKGLEESLSSMISQRQLSIPVDPAADKLRKGIISQFLSIGKTAQAAKDWAEKYGVNGNKRKFNDYTNQELWLLRRNAEKMKQDFINALNKTNK